MTLPLSMVVTIRALPGEEPAVHAALLRVVAETRAEKGCVQYDLHRDSERPGRFVFYETWASRDDWAAHDQADHIVALKRILEGKTEDAAIVWLEKLEP